MSLCILFPPHVDGEKRLPSINQEPGAHQTELSSTLILEFVVSRTVISKHLLYKPPRSWWFVIVTKLTKIKLIPKFIAAITNACKCERSLETQQRREPERVLR